MNSESGFSPRQEDWKFPGFVLSALLLLTCSTTVSADFSDDVTFVGGAESTAATAGRASAGRIDDSGILAAHNKWRSEVGVPGLTYSRKLAASAQAWADQLKNSNGCNMKHSGGQSGENIFWQSALMWSDGRRELSRVASKDVVDAWGSEKKHYRYANNSCASFEVCGHYTQLVWKKTTSVGCGMAVCGNQDQIWVCQYSPAGNWAGEKPY